ncbi:MAG: hypothetical protein AVDCRST_MAG11-359, partial [uncultured Gemmatimonadaceae bacterium]
EQPRHPRAPVRRRDRLRVRAAPARHRPERHHRGGRPPPHRTGTREAGTRDDEQRRGPRRRARDVRPDRDQPRPEARRAHLPHGADARLRGARRDRARGVAVEPRPDVHAGAAEPAAGGARDGDVRGDDGARGLARHVHAGRDAAERDASGDRAHDVHPPV